MQHRIPKKTFFLISLLLMALIVSACAPEAPPPTATPVPTVEPTQPPATEAAATEAPVEEPTPAPTEEPTAEPTPAPSEEPAQASSLEGVTWQVTGYRNLQGKPAAPEGKAILTFQNGQLTGNGGCNSFYASYTLDGAQLTIVTQDGSPPIVCDDVTMAREQAILADLNEVASYAVKDGQLSLFNSDSVLLLSLTAQAAPTLDGVVWKATNINNGREAVVGLIEGAEITAIFAGDGSLSGSAGCNNYVASYTVDGDKLTIGVVTNTMMFCADPEGVMEQEAAYLAALGTVATYSIRDGVLELRTADGALAVRYVVATDSVVVSPEAASADPNPAAEDAKAAPVAFAAATTVPSGRITAPLGVNIRVGPGTQHPIGDACSRWRRLADHSYSG